MLEQLIGQGEEIYEELCQMEKGDELERMTWAATVLRYIESYLSGSVVSEGLLELGLLEKPLEKKHVIYILAILKSELTMEQLGESIAN